MRLGKTYSNGRLEAASKRALELNACSFQSLKSILKQSLDRQTALTPEPERSGPAMRIFAALTTSTRPPTCCSNRQPKGQHMLNHPTSEKLHSVKRHGMADAFHAQLETADTSQLGFEER